MYIYVQNKKSTIMENEWRALHDYNHARQKENVSFINHIVVY